MGKCKYDAFISYRHTEPDKYVATTLHKKLENFKLPKKYREKCGRSKIERVFRDQDELPLSSNLSDSIDDALHNTDFLIVICSPRLPQSQWCLQEIETFISLYGRERILAVLCEGEPHESFPEALVKEKVERVDENGETIVEYRNVEPLAADVRGKSKAQINKAIDDAVLRIAAPMFGLDYDDLKQRHRERKLKRLISFISVVATVLLVFSLVSMSMALQIKSQSNQIQLQNDEITKRNAEIEEQNAKIEEQYIEASKKYAVSAALNAEEMISYGRKKDALYTLLQAMPKSSTDTSYPYTSKTEKTLLEVLEPYAATGDHVMKNVYEADSTVSKIDLSADSAYSLVCDSEYGISVWNNETGENVFATDAYNDGSSRYTSAFAPNGDIMYVNLDHELIRHSLSDGKETKITDGVFDIRIHAGVNLCTVIKERSLEVYNLEDNSLFHDFKVDIDTALSLYFRGSAISNDGSKFILGYHKEEDILSIYDVESGKEIIANGMGEYEIKWIEYDEDRCYVLCDKFQIDAKNFYVGKVYAFNLDTGKKLWEKDVDDSLKDAIVTDGENSKLYAKSFYSVYCFDKDTGEILDAGDANTRLLTINSYVGNDTVFLYNSKGECVYFPGSSEAFVSSNYFYTYPKEEIEQVDVSSKGILVYFKNSNYVVYYEYYIAPEREYLPVSGMLIVANDSGTKALELTKDEEDNSILRIYDIATGATYEIAYNAYNYYFMGEGEEFALQYLDRIDICDVNDGTVKRSIEVEKGCILCSLSADGKYVSYRKYPENNEIYVASLETGEKVSSYTLDFKLEMGDEVYPIGDDVVICECHANDTISLFKDGKEEPVLVKDISWGFVGSTVVTSDCKYYIVGYKDNSVEIFDIENNLESYSVMYDLDDYIKSVKYYEEKGYIFNFVAGSVVTNEDFEEKAVLPYNYGYVRNNGYLKNDENGWYYANSFTLDELLDMAREQLGDYVPSERTKKQYNIT